MTVKTKELKIRRLKTYAMYEVYYEDGGQVPKELAGHFTSQVMARQRIAAYLASGKKRNGPKTNTGTK